MLTINSGVPSRGSSPASVGQFSEAGSSLERFVGYLSAGDHRGAIGYATQLLDQGTSAGELVLRLLVPAQATVGLNWERGEWSIVMEHAATEITEAVLAVAGARASTAPDRGRLVVICAETERHTLPARMIAELLRFQGFVVVFLGSATRPDSLTGFLSTFKPDALIVSCSVAINLPSVVPMVTAAADAGVPALCGGRAFGADEHRARQLGASPHRRGRAAIGGAESSTRSFGSSRPRSCSPTTRSSPTSPHGCTSGQESSRRPTRISIRCSRQ